MARTFAVLVVTALPLAGCGAATLVVKKPVVDQCAGMGLKKCDDLSEAVLEYVDGNKADAEKKLLVVARANEPEKVKALAKALEPIAKSIGGDIGGAMTSVLAILSDAESSPTAETKTLRPQAKAASVAAGANPMFEAPQTYEGAASATKAPEPTTEMLKTGMSRPSVDPSGVACGNADRCRRVAVASGPMTITNLYASGGCPDELFVSAGGLDGTHWQIVVLPNNPLNVAGKFAVDGGEKVYVGARSQRSEVKADEHCTLVWSGLADP